MVQKKKETSSAQGSLVREDPGRLAYVSARRAHWDEASSHYARPRRLGDSYHDMLKNFFRHMIPEGRRILELGSGTGDLLAGLNPSLGVGVDFSEKMVGLAKEKHPQLHFVVGDAARISFSKPFDFIILSDLVNDLFDAQELMENLRHLCHPGTRVIINFMNNLWRIPMGMARSTGKVARHMEQNWFSPHDVVNLLELSGFESVRQGMSVLFPFRVWGLTGLFNRLLSHFWPFTWMCLAAFVVARLSPKPVTKKHQPSVTVLVPARNEAGNIRKILERTPVMGKWTEVMFVEGGSTDDTYETIEKEIDNFPEKRPSLYRQTGKGKGDAVRLGFSKARGDILMILDADMTVPPENLPRFYEAIRTGKGEFVNGVRLVYPLEDQSMRFLNMLGNRFFSMAFSWLLGQPINDTLCGTKVLSRANYELVAQNRSYFGDFDPFGDFDLLFGAAKLNLRLVEVPIRYRERTYGDTNIDRWRHGWQLLKMTRFAARRIKFIKY